MANTPSFKCLPNEGEIPVPEPGLKPAVPERHERVGVYHKALDFTARVFLVLEFAETEGHYLRDQLDRKSAVVPKLVAQGLVTADMKLRRVLYLRARQSLTDCAVILDTLIERRMVKLGVLEPARLVAVDLLDELLELTVPPLKMR